MFLRIQDIIDSLGLDPSFFESGTFQVFSPVNGEEIARIALADNSKIPLFTARAQDAFKLWRDVPAPDRGDLIRLFADELTKHKEDLAYLISIESGKPMRESVKEIDLIIGYCHFTMTLARQLYGLTAPSEKRGQMILEYWHPLGPCVIMTSFSFPASIWGMNALLALVCGNSIIWKPSLKTPLSAFALHTLLRRAMARFSQEAPEFLSQVLICDKEGGKDLIADSKVRLVTVTGNSMLGREFAPILAGNMKRSFLSLSGNNAMIISQSADLDAAVRTAVSEATGTTGQRAASLRRLICHADIAPIVVSMLETLYASFVIDSPAERLTDIGPLIDKRAFDRMQQALSVAEQEGGKIFGGERLMVGHYENAYYVRPAIVQMPYQTEIVMTETFAPILYVMTYRSFDAAVAMNNEVPQGLGSILFSNDLREIGHFLSIHGSDCGIVNINSGLAALEVGVSFGGEKETGGAREGGMDNWKNFMRRMTSYLKFE